MIHVVASIQFDQNQTEALKSIYRELVPQVLAENGCLQYQPTFDFETDLPNQDKNASLITVTEIWESYEAFQAHLKAPHVIIFREQIKGNVEKVTVKILQPFA